MASKGSAESDARDPVRLVVVYVCDSLRRDHLSCYGYERPTSPHVDELAADGVVFEQAFAESTWTRPSAASLLTSLYPPTHGVITRLDGMPAGVRTLPAVLREGGFRTLGLSAMGNVSTHVGFGNGFDEFLDLYKDPEIIRRRGAAPARPMFHMVGETAETADARAEDINERLFELLDASPAGGPVFAFIWSIDTHDPYDPPEADRVFTSPGEGGMTRATNRDIAGARTPAEVQGLLDLYDGEIHCNDRAVGELVRGLKGRGLYDATLFVFTGDHGEAFGEHGHSGHSGHPYDERIAIPLVVKLPGGKWAGRRCGAFAQLVDVAPTVLGCLGIEPPPFWQGRSLLEALDGAAPGRRGVFCHYRMREDAPEVACFRTRRHKLVEVSAAAKRVLYDVRATPPEAPVGRSLSALGRKFAMAVRLRGWRKECRLRRQRLGLPQDQRVRLAEDPQLLQQMRHLGYL